MSETFTFERGKIDHILSDLASLMLYFKDLRDIPDEIKQHMKFTFVATMDEVLQAALLPKAPIADKAPEPAVVETPAVRAPTSAAPTPP